MSWSYFLYCFHIPSNIIKKHGSSVCVLLPGPMHRGDSATAQLWKKTAQFKSIKLTNCHLLYFLYYFFSCLRFLFVCRTGDLVLISPHFLALGCQLPVLHHDDKSHRYQTTSPSLGGSPGPGSSRPRSQRLQPTSKPTSVAALGWGQPPANTAIKSLCKSSAQQVKLWERPSCPGGTRQGWHGGKQTPKNRTPRNIPLPWPAISREYTLQRDLRKTCVGRAGVCTRVIWPCQCKGIARCAVPRGSTATVAALPCASRTGRSLSKCLLHLLGWACARRIGSGVLISPSEFGLLFFTVLPGQYCRTGIFVVASLSMFQLLYNVNQICSLPNVFSE